MSFLDAHIMVCLMRWVLELQLLHFLIISLFPNVVCMCLSLSFTRKARRFSRRRYAIKGYEFFRTSSFKLSMVRSLVIIVLRLREAGLKVTNNGIPCLPFCFERIGWKAWSREHALLW